MLRSWTRFQDDARNVIPFNMLESLDLSLCMLLLVALGRRQAETNRLLRMKAAGSKDAPNLIIKSGR